MLGAGGDEPRHHSPESHRTVGAECIARRGTRRTPRRSRSPGSSSPTPGSADTSRYYVHIIHHHAIPSLASCLPTASQRGRIRTADLHEEDQLESISRPALSARRGRPPLQRRVTSVLTPVNQPPSVHGRCHARHPAALGSVAFMRATGSGTCHTAYVRSRRGACAHTRTRVRLPNQNTVV